MFNTPSTPPLCSWPTTTKIAGFSDHSRQRQQEKGLTKTVSASGTLLLRVPDVR